MQIDLVNVRDDAQCARVYDVLVASKSFGRPWNQPPSLAESIVEWRHTDKAEPTEMWAVWNGDDALGVATLWLPQDDNTSMMYCDVQVAPEHRRRKVGSALVGRLEQRATQEERTTLVTDIFVPEDSEGHPYRRFLEAHGFTLAWTELMRHLELPVAAGVLSNLADEARPRYEGSYRLETHVNGVPDAQRDSLCAVMNRLAVDAPTGEIEFEAESLTPARYQEHLDVERDQHRTRLTTIAIDEATGDVVAYSDLALPAGGSTLSWQWGTLVLKEHRGHRLGMAVKVQNLRRLQSDHPGRERVVTGNADTNRWMVEINERLGFSIVELAPTYRRRLD